MSEKFRAAITAVLQAADTARRVAIVEAAKERLENAESAAVIGVVRVIDPEAVPTVKAVSDRELVPAGEHDVEIAAASIREVRWKVSDDNPTGECLSLRLRLDDFAFIFADTPLDWSKAVADVEAATGHTKDDVAAMTGEIVRVVVEHYAGRNGTRAIVKKWIPRVTATATAPARPSVVKVGPSRVSAKPAWEAEDDGLPF